MCEDLERGIREFRKRRVCVIGDLMVDEYVTGVVSRVSPEAPVAVLDFREKSRRAGGAANVAVNVDALGAECLSVGIAAEDDGGRWLRSCLDGHGIRTDGIFWETGRGTTVKTRFTTREQQLLRVDRELSDCIGEESRSRILSFVEGHVGGLDAVILSDYRKGVLLDGAFVRRLIALCVSAGVFVAVDSKSRALEDFTGADLIKPNKGELESAVGIRVVDAESLDRAGRLYLERAGVRNLVVTRGESGISVFRPGECRQDFASRALQVYDVTGAGDTVIAAVTLAMCSGIGVHDAVRLANVAAGIVVSRSGTASVTAEELEGRLHAGQDMRA